MIRKQIAVLALALSAAAGLAQTIARQPVASQFNNWRAPGTTNLVAGANPLVPISACSITAGGANLYALQASTPIKINDPGNPAIDEIITPTVVVQGGSCTATLTTTNAHPAPWYITSGTYGLQDAINSTALSGQLNSIVLDTNWWQAGGTSTIISAAAGNKTTSIVDVTVSPNTAYGWNGTNYVGTSSILSTALPTIAAGAAAGSSPTVTNTALGLGTAMQANVATGTATTTGTLFTETVGTVPALSRAVNCTIQSIGANVFPLPITTTSSGGVCTFAVATAPTVSTPYVFSVHVN